MVASPTEAIQFYVHGYYKTIPLECQVLLFNGYKYTLPSIDYFMYNNDSLHFLTGSEVLYLIDANAFMSMLEELADEIPPELYDGLCGGISMSMECKPSPYAKNNDLFIAGEYTYDSRLGSRITIYYGSFMRLYGSMTPDAMKTRLRKTLRHEFRHHIEHKSGFRDLEVEDEIFISQYLKRAEHMS